MTIDDTRDPTDKNVQISPQQCPIEKHNYGCLAAHEIRHCHSVARTKHGYFFLLLAAAPS
eukprot:scaffold103152_cov30-Tisochrysis_lutea.AAC.1